VGTAPDAVESANPSAFEIPPELVTLSWTAVAFPAKAFEAIVIASDTVIVPPAGSVTRDGGGEPGKSEPSLLGSGLTRPVVIEICSDDPIKLWT
jgi:hypothetical protein